MNDLCLVLVFVTMAVIVICMLGAGYYAWQFICFRDQLNELKQKRPTQSIDNSENYW